VTTALNDLAFAAGALGVLVLLFFFLGPRE